VGRRWWFEAELFEQAIEEPGFETIGVYVDAPTAGRLGRAAVVAHAAARGRRHVLATKSTLGEPGREPLVMPGRCSLPRRMIERQLQSSERVAIKDRWPAVPGNNLALVSAVAHNPGIAQEPTERRIRPMVTGR
jgi:hypothetical protein